MGHHPRGLETFGDGSINFDVRLFTGTGPTDVVSRAELKDYIEELFKDDSDIALFYFAGHGHIEAAGGYLLASDSSRGDEGVSLAEVLHFANDSLMEVSSQLNPKGSRTDFA